MTRVHGCLGSALAYASSGAVTGHFALEPDVDDVTAAMRALLAASAII